ncbi:hypothetical protein STAS_33405 [Striga asiatica]|uniref:Uncharacterized protein n=1 Tax=Striga asiatica TaxID=4170 RepID=A0A5A7RE82_STRAF|nr:hypothetical protein STAS_33405 [Striga asiatica]
MILDRESAGLDTWRGAEHILNFFPRKCQLQRIVTVNEQPFTLWTNISSFSFGKKQRLGSSVRCFSKSHQKFSTRIHTAEKLYVIFKEKELLIEYQYLQLVVASTGCKESRLPKRTFGCYCSAKTGTEKAILFPSHLESLGEGLRDERSEENTPARVNLSVNLKFTP